MATLYPGYIALRRRTRPTVNRKFGGRPTKILTIRVEEETIRAIDKHMRESLPHLRRNRSELIRRLLEQELRESERAG